MNLFSGCGGLSLGFQAAGLVYWVALMLMKQLLIQLRTIYLGGFGFEGFHLCCDIRHVDGEVFSNIEEQDPSWW